ncbi:MAG: SRPBCC family protein [Mucilaginibacter sp.]
MIANIRKEVVVEASQQVAFDVFTQKMDLWWPKTHHIGKTPMVESVLAHGVKGRWYSKHEDGSKVNVGHVLAWDPYGRLILAWQINGEYQYQPDLITEVEVNFIPEGPKTTRVKFEHRNLDRLAGGSKAIAEMDEGWRYIMNLYKRVADEA